MPSAPKPSPRQGTETPRDSMATVQWWIFSAQEGWTKIVHQSLPTRREMERIRVGPEMRVRGTTWRGSGADQC